MGILHEGKKNAITMNSYFFFYCYADHRDLHFPYTTLFRSGRKPETAFARIGRPRANAERLSAGRQVDRKSTRLNSSHVEISYAVFCLKKKSVLPTLTQAVH